MCAGPQEARQAQSEPRSSASVQQRGLAQCRGDRVDRRSDLAGEVSGLSGLGQCSGLGGRGAGKAAPSAWRRISGSSTRDPTFNRQLCRSFRPGWRRSRTKTAPRSSKGPRRHSSAIRGQGTRRRRTRKRWPPSGAGQGQAAAPAAALGQPGSVAPFPGCWREAQSRLAHMQNPPLLLPQEPGQGAVRLPALPPPRAFHHAMLVSGRERRSTPGRMGAGSSPRDAQPCSTRSPRHAVSGSSTIRSSAARPAGCF